MAGTDRRRKSTPGGPAIILVGPQLGENIGTAARAMLNFGLTDLRLVRPKAGWPNVKALNAASGADEVIAGVRQFATTDEAVADLARVYATTARPRDMIKPVMDAHGAAREMRRASERGERCGVLFGPERTGLGNDDLVRAETIVAIELNPAFSSLNLAQAVLLVAYEWFRSGMAGEAKPASVPLKEGARLATKAELDNFHRHLEAALDEAGFFASRSMRPSIVRNLRNLFGRAMPTEQEVRTLHGVVERLRSGPRRGRNP